MDHTWSQVRNLRCNSRNWCTFLLDFLAAENMFWVQTQFFVTKSSLDDSMVYSHEKAPDEERIRWKERKEILSMQTRPEKTECLRKQGVRIFRVVAVTSRHSLLLCVFFSPKIPCVWNTNESWGSDLSLAFERSSQLPTRFQKRKIIYKVQMRFCNLRKTYLLVPNPVRTVLWKYRARKHKYILFSHP